MVTPPPPVVEYVTSFSRCYFYVTIGRFACKFVFNGAKSGHPILRKGLGYPHGVFAFLVDDKPRRKEMMPLTFHRGDIQRTVVLLPRYSVTYSVLVHVKQRKVFPLPSTGPWERKG